MKIKTTLTVLFVSVAASHAAIVVQTTRGGSGDQANLSATSPTNILGAGQTFTSGSLGGETLLSSIDLIMPTTVNGADPAGPFTVEIWTDFDNDATTFNPNVLVAGSDNQITIVGGDVTLTANFSSGTLADNTVYLLSFNDGTNSHATFRMGLTADGGAGGPLGSSGKLFHNGGDPAFGDNRELAFTVTTTQVPEPSSAALLGLGGLALILRRKK